MADQMLRISPGFQYSVNIKHDIDNGLKISSYIPTEKAILLLEDLVKSLNPQSHDRSRLVVGPYGTGKSHLVAVFGAILRHKLDYKFFEPILEKISASNKPKLAKELGDIALHRRFLTVIINGNGKNLEQSLMAGLQKALKEEGLEDIIPDTIYSQIQTKIKSWKNEYQITYDSFKSLLNKESGITLDEFTSLLDNCDPKSHQIFRSLYPELTSGSDFNPFHVSDTAELYHDIAIKIKDKFNGINVIFDEFNKYLESAVKSQELLDLKPLQDFAEMCNRSEEHQVHLIIVSHQHISQYASKLSLDLVNEWRKVEGRFKPFELTQNSAKTYNLISKVIIKNQVKWQEFTNIFHDKLQYLSDKANLFGLFKELSQGELHEWVVKGCFPLHPVTTFCLPRLSNKIAQNERTLFTFLATNDFYSLGKFIEEYNEGIFNLVTIDVLFDYFSDLMKKQNYNDPIFNVWVQVNRSIQKLAEPNVKAERFLKALGIIKIVSEEQSLPPTTEILKFALSETTNNDEYEEIIKLLSSDKIIYIRKSDGHIHFFDGSDVDFNDEILKVKGTYKYQPMFNISRILNEYFLPYPILANRYNDQNEMTRYFWPKFYTYEELVQGVDWDKELIDLGYADGILALVVLSEENMEISVEKLFESNRHDQILFAISSVKLNIAEILFDYQALELLKMDKKFVEQDPKVLVELEAYLDDYEEQIKLELSKLTEPRSGLVNYYYLGKRIENINSGAKLSRCVSNICEKVFCLSPKINNELINKNSITSTISTARKKVISGILEQHLKPNLGLTGFGPDVSIFRSLLVRTGIFEEREDQVILGKPKEENLAYIIHRIDEWILDSSSKSKNMEEIYAILRKPPYGVRLGIIPIIIALSLRKYSGYMVIKDSRGIEQPFSPEVLDAMSKHPNNYYLELESWDSAKEEYIKQLSILYSEFINKTKASSNRLFPVAMGLKNWFISLPKFTRETQLGSEFAELKRVLRSPSTDSKELLLKKIPKSICGDQYFVSDNYLTYLKKITEAKNYLDGHLDGIKTELNSFLAEVFGGTKQESSLSRIRTWFEALNQQTKIHLFSGSPGIFINTLKQFTSYDNYKFINQLAKNMMGLRVEDWSDDLWDAFKQAIIDTKKEIEDFNLDMRSEKSFLPNLVKIIHMGYDGEKKEQTFEKTEISEMGELLLNNLESSIDSFADSISLNEKRQILLSLLERLV